MKEGDGLTDKKSFKETWEKSQENSFFFTINHKYWRRIFNNYKDGLHAWIWLVGEIMRMQWKKEKEKPCKRKEQVSGFKTSLLLVFLSL